MDIGDWLRKLGLEHYEPAFRENRVDSEILPLLTAEDLKDLGVVLVGDRRRLMEAIAALRGEHATAPAADSASIEQHPSAGSDSPAAAQSAR